MTCRNQCVPAVVAFATKNDSRSVFWVKLPDAPGDPLACHLHQGIGSDAHGKGSLLCRLHLFGNDNHERRLLRYLSSNAGYSSPRNANNRRMTSSMRLLGQEAPAVIPMFASTSGIHEASVVTSCLR